MNAERGGQAEKKEYGRCTMVIIPPTDEAAARQWSKTTTATGLLCPPETPATFPQLTLASIYNQPHTIRGGIKGKETYRYFLYSTEE